MALDTSNITKNEAVKIACNTLAAIREKSPLVLNFTNTVVQPITANLLLAIGASPAMLSDGSEAEDMLRICANALLINVGTLSRAQSEEMEKAVAAAAKNSVPWVLDPVAVGLLGLRTNFVKKILAAGTPPALVRGNASEILATAGYEAKTRGAESTCGSESAIEAGKQLARKTGGAVLVTGETDFVTDGDKIAALGNGDIMMTRVTGVGCAMGALSAACVAVAETPFAGGVASALIMGIAGNIAAERCRGSGSFAVELLDAMYNLSESDIHSRAIVRE